MKQFSQVKTVFIDLDDTIWDFSANSRVALTRVFHRYGLDKQCSCERFLAAYMPRNKMLWELYHHGKITKEYLKSERFRGTFEECGIQFDDPTIPLQFDEDYLEDIVTCSTLVDGARELLDYLSKRFAVNILSNGFAKLQRRKLRSGGVESLVAEIVLSDDIGVTKPDRRLFDYALERVGGNASTTLMIGDNYDADILGAKNAGWRAIYFNRSGSLLGAACCADAEVESLRMIPDLI